MKNKIVILTIASLMVTSAAFAAETSAKKTSTKKVETKVEKTTAAAVEAKTTVSAVEVKNDSGFPIIIGSEKITEADLAAEVENIPQQYRSYYETEDGKKRIIDNLVQQKLIKIDAIKKGVEKEEGFIVELNKIKEKVIANYMVKKEILDKVALTDDELKAEYEKKKESFKSGESVKAAHILLMPAKDAKQEEKDKLKTKAEEILKDALDGKDFGELAKANSADSSASNGGDLGWFEKGAMVKPFEEASFAGEKGKVYPKVVETQFGYHIIKVLDKKESGYKDFEEVKDQLKDEALKNKQMDQFTKWIDGLKKEYMTKTEEKK